MSDSDASTLADPSPLANGSVLQPSMNSKFDSTTLSATPIHSQNGYRLPPQTYPPRSSDGVSADAGFNYNIVAVFGSQSTGGEHALEWIVWNYIRCHGRDETATNDKGPLFLGQHQNLHKSCLLAFKSVLHATLSGDGTSYNFGKDKTKKMSSLFAPDRLDIDRDEDERRRVWNDTVIEVVDLALSVAIVWAVVSIATQASLPPSSKSIGVHDSP
ncbi:hypothetical protein HD554DRAFT_2036987 [Boletus coccyginus]|nr:hypothetical protein HD554DRAFT_2036987 [Boletus coccyginus]